MKSKVATVFGDCNAFTAAAFKASNTRLGVAAGTSMLYVDTTS